MKLIVKICAIITLLMLQACATQTKQHVEQGKQLFQHKQYALAMQHLKPAAVEGNADAQYAIGYMYYYGQGVPANRDAGFLWIHKAAQQGQTQAKRALIIIEHSATFGLS